MTASSTPHDALFRALLDDVDRAATILKDYLPSEIACRLTGDPPVPMEGSFIDDSLAGSQSDRLFAVRLADGGHALIYALLEHKSTPDPRTPIQLLTYRARIWDRYGGENRFRDLPPIFPIVFYHGSRSWTVPLSVIGCIAGDRPVLDTQREMGYTLCDLNDRDDACLSDDRAVKATFLALKHLNKDDVPWALLVKICGMLPDDTLLERQVIQYILWNQRWVTIDLFARIARQSKPERGGDMVSIAAEEWMKQGRTEGMAHGMAKGMEKGMAKGVARGEADALSAVLLDILETRFGPLDADIRRQIGRLSTPELHQATRRAATCSALHEVFGTDQPR